MYLFKSTTWDRVCSVSRFVTKVKTNIFISPASDGSNLMQYGCRATQQSGRERGGAPLTNNWYQGEIMVLSNVLKCFRKGYNCLQGTRTLVYTGYQNSGVYRTTELWLIQDTRTLMYTGYQNSGVYRIPEP